MHERLETFVATQGGMVEHPLPDFQLLEFLRLAAVQDVDGPEQSRGVLVPVHMDTGEVYGTKALVDEAFVSALPDIAAPYFSRRAIGNVSLYAFGFAGSRTHRAISEYIGYQNRIVVVTEPIPRPTQVAPLCVYGSDCEAAQELSERTHIASACVVSKDDFAALADEIDVYESDIETDVRSDVDMAAVAPIADRYKTAAMLPYTLERSTAAAVAQLAQKVDHTFRTALEAKIRQEHALSHQSIDTIRQKMYESATVKELVTKIIAASKPLVLQDYASRTAVDSIVLNPRSLFTEILPLVTPADQLDIVSQYEPCNFEAILAGGTLYTHATSPFTSFDYIGAEYARQ
jgi:hypothetical protein